MGREKKTAELSLAQIDNTPLPDAEFLLIDHADFTVPFDNIKVVGRNDLNIQGHWNTDVAVTKKFLDQKNKFPVNVKFNQEDHFPMTETCFILIGRTTIGELSTLVHNQLQLNPEAQLVFSIDGKLFAYDVMLSSLYKDHMSSGGFLNIMCSYGPEAHGENAIDGEDV